MKTKLKLLSLTILALFLLAITDFALAVAQSEQNDMAQIKEYNAQLVEPYKKNLGTIKQLKAQHDAVSKGRSALDKNTSGKYNISDSEVSESLGILKERGLYLDINQLIREAGQMYKKGKNNPAYRPKFQKLSELILEMQAHLDRGDKDIESEWNDAVEIYQSLKESLG